MIESLETRRLRSCPRRSTIRFPRPCRRKVNDFPDEQPGSDRRQFRQRPTELERQGIFLSAGHENPRGIAGCPVVLRSWTNGTVSRKCTQGGHCRIYHPLGDRVLGYIGRAHVCLVVAIGLCYGKRTTL